MPPGARMPKTSFSADSPVGNFSQHGHHEDAVGHERAKFTFSNGGGDKPDIAKTGCACFRFGTAEHLRLHIDRDYLTGGADPFRCRNGEPSGTAPDIQHRHAVMQVEISENHRGSIGAGERVVEFDHPSQP